MEINFDLAFVHPYVIPVVLTTLLSVYSTGFSMDLAMLV